MTRRLCVSPATREAIHHNPRPKEYCPKHGPAYSAKGCEQCAYEKNHTGYAAPSIWSEFARVAEGKKCRVTFETTIECVRTDGLVSVFIPEGASSAGRVLILPKKAVTPLLEVKG